MAGTVLLVDDDPAMLKVMRMTLEAAGFRVFTAHDGAAALKVIQREALAIGVAVIDFQIPGSRLSDLLGDIRSQPGRIRSIVISGYSLDFLEEFGGSLPMGVDFLKKPFMPRELVAAVRRAFTRVAGTGS